MERTYSHTFCITKEMFCRKNKVFVKQDQQLPTPCLLNNFDIFPVFFHPLDTL